MIIWIDGPYGVGKSTLAEAICGMRPGVHIFDAEEVGNAVRDNLPPELFNGFIFEGYPLWFEFCIKLIAQIARAGRDVLVPMTLTEPDSFEKIAAPLRAEGFQVRHLLLCADAGTVRRRILARGEDEGCWCMENIGLCLERQGGFEGCLRLDAASDSPEELARRALKALQL